MDSFIPLGHHNQPFRHTDLSGLNQRIQFTFRSFFYRRIRTRSEYMIEKSRDGMLNYRIFQPTAGLKGSNIMSLVAGL